MGEAETLPSLSTDCSLEMESEVHKRSDGKIISAHKDSCSDNDGGLVNIQSAHVEQRCACEETINREICSTSGCHQFISMSLQGSRSHRSGERGKRKRWRGRSGDLSHMSDIFYDGSSKSDLCATVSSAGTNILQGKEVILACCNVLNVCD